jgi:phage terminase large subunit
VQELQARAQKGNFVFRAHLLPHDIEARELATGQSRRATLTNALPEPVITVPRHDPDDGIKVARSVLGLSWFDRDKTRLGLSRLRAYKRSKTGMPVHDDASHGADGFRTACVGLPLVSSSWLARPGRLRRRLRGLI